MIKMLLLMYGFTLNIVKLSRNMVFIDYAHNIVEDMKVTP